MAAMRFADNKRWLDVVGEPIFSIQLLEAGRQLFAEEKYPPAEKPKRSPARR